jgi:hypothetical protein
MRSASGVWAMKRYFFDVVGQNRSEYDYRGRELATVEMASKLAELIALDLGIDPHGGRTGWTVSVRDSQGREVFSMQVRESELIAA